MKHLLALSLAALLPTAVASPCAADVDLSVASAAVGITPPNERAIRDAAADRGKAARASWWGFDPADATTALQAAINSGARTVIVEDMGAPWVTDKLKLASDQEIVFETGVVVLAKRGAFHGSGDCLFSATAKKNITLTGHGATLRMWKRDYDDPAQYKRAEWRHVLGIWSCAGVRVTGLTLADSGGDGIYLGAAQKGVPCSDVVIKNVACVSNYRQGISVISARNLLIEDCVLKDTGGTAPGAGIDFEPNGPDQELTNCVMRNCVSENNRGDAYTFYLPNLRAESKPISIRLEDCRAVAGTRSVSFTTADKSETAGVKGTAEFINCHFKNSQQVAIRIGAKPVTGARVRFVNCEIANPAAGQPALTPIQFTSGTQGVSTIGGVHFEACTIRDSLPRPPMSYRDMAGGAGLSEITGTLVVQQADQRTTYELTPKLIFEWMPFRAFKPIPRFNAADVRYEPALTGAKPDPSQRSTARQRGLAEWLLWAEANERVTFSVLIRRVGKSGPDAAAVSLRSPSGKLTKLSAASSEKETPYEFQATERGAYTIACQALNSTATVNSPTNRVCIYSPSSALHFLNTTGQFFFWVPPGTKEFAVKVSGENTAEGVKAALIDPAGNLAEEKDNISQAHQFVATPRDTARGEIWSLRLAKPTTGTFEDFFVQLQGIPPLVSPTREALLRPMK